MVKSIVKISRAKRADVPTWVRMAVGFFALLNLTYGIMSYLDMSVLYNDAQGLDLDNAILKHANYEFAARSLAIGLASVVVTIIKGGPETIVILTIVRALIEIQTIIISLLQGYISAMLTMQFAFLVVEVFIIKTLIGVIKEGKRIEEQV